MGKDLYELKHKDGVFHDPALRFSLSRNDKKPLPDKIPIGSLLAQALEAGGIVRCDPEETTEEICQQKETAPNTSEGTEEPATTDEPAEVQGQADGQEADGAADHRVEKAAPAPSKKRATRKKAKEKAEK